MSDIQYDKLNWYKVAELDELDEGRVKSATAGTKSIAVVHFDGQYAAMDSKVAFMFRQSSKSIGETMYLS